MNIIVHMINLVHIYILVHMYFLVHIGTAQPQLVYILFYFILFYFILIYFISFYLIVWCQVVLTNDIIEKSVTHTQIHKGVYIVAPQLKMTQTKTQTIYEILISFSLFDKVPGLTVAEISKISSFPSHHCVRYIRNLSIYRTQWWDEKLKIVNITITVCPRTLCEKQKLLINEVLDG